MIFLGGGLVIYLSEVILCAIVKFKDYSLCNVENVFKIQKSDSVQIKYIKCSKIGQ